MTRKRSNTLTTGQKKSGPLRLEGRVSARHLRHPHHLDHQALTVRSQRNELLDKTVGVRSYLGANRLFCWCLIHTLTGLYSDFSITHHVIYSSHCHDQLPENLLKGERTHRAPQPSHTLSLSLETQKPLCPQVSLVVHITSSLENVSATLSTRADTSKKEKSQRGDSTSN